MINRNQAGSWQGQCAEQAFVAIKELHGNQQHGRKLSTQSYSIFKLVTADAIKCTNKDPKYKAIAAAKLQCNRYNLSATAVDNLRFRIEYSR